MYIIHDKNEFIVFCRKQCITLGCLHENSPALDLHGQLRHSRFLKLQVKLRKHKKTYESYCKSQDA